MQRKETAIEVKVGALVLISAAIFAGFVFALGDFSFGEKHFVYVDFDNASGLKVGADVRIAGIPAGRIDNIEFLGGQWDEVQERYVFVRCRLAIDDGMQDAIGEGAELLITTLGVLGEPYVEITNTTPPGAPVGTDAYMVGQTPVRLDQVIATVSNGLENVNQLVDTVKALINRNEEGLTRLVTNAANLTGNLDELIVRNMDPISGTVSSLDYILTENRDRVAPILTNVEGMTGEFEQVGSSINRALGNGDTLRSALNSLDSILDEVDEHAENTLTSIERVMGSAETILSENEEEISHAVQNVEVITDNLAAASEDVAELTDHINSGRGAIGAILRDDELYDDLRELIRELKRRPWRLLWRE